MTPARRPRWTRGMVLAALLAAACGDPPPPQTQAQTQTPEASIGTERGDSLRPARDHFAEGCDTDADCTIAEDPCGYAQAILASRRDEYEADFEGLAYDCPPVEYAAPPVATCESSRCVGRVPSE